MINSVVGEAFQSSNNQGQTEKMKIIRPYFNIVKSTSFRLKKERKTEKKKKDLQKHDINCYLYAR